MVSILFCQLNNAMGSVPQHKREFTQPLDNS